MPWSSRGGYPARSSQGGTLPGGYSTGGTLWGGTLPGGTLPGVPCRGYPAGGYPGRGVPWQGGTLAGGVPCQGGTQVGQQKECSSTRRAVCLLRSRRRTFLFSYGSSFPIRLIMILIVLQDSGYIVLGQRYFGYSTFWTGHFRFESENSFFAPLLLGTSSWITLILDLRFSKLPSPTTRNLNFSRITLTWDLRSSDSLFFSLWRSGVSRSIFMF